MSSKSKRDNNFSTEEELLLLDEIGKTKDVLEIKKTNNISIKEKWNNYTTKLLKEPVNERRRPKVPNPIFTAREEYYKHKSELTQVIIEANEETRRFEKKQVIAVNKEAREQEEQAKRMTLLDFQRPKIV
ncbi:hypothetical protein JTB14_002240 [Gonioctena quinquepunctata]|nr:hypothetical protein JTB14_002240 [Gonioctena quinquepunctata]